MEDIYPKMMTIRQIANTGILPEHALRMLVKQDRVPYMMVGAKALINYTKLLDYLKVTSKN